jgi:7-keto-8-aminopelargonate synthetase-like enzyme
MDGTIAPLEELCGIVDDHDAWLMVDGAHATGEDGGGVVEERGLEDRVEIQMGHSRRRWPPRVGILRATRL